MKPKLKIAGWAVIVLILAGVIVWKWTFRKSEDSVGRQEAVYEMESAVLLGEFETDENAANAKYLGKVISVSGNIDTITEDSLKVTVYLKNGEDYSGVMCDFSKDVIDTGSIKQGDKVKVKGICNGYLLDVILNKCVIVE